MMTTTMDLNGFNSSISGGIIGGLHLDKMGMASETDDLLDVWDSDLQQSVSDALRPDMDSHPDTLIGSNIFDGLIRHDRLLTDSLNLGLGLLPPGQGLASEPPVVKTEHSYSMAGSDGDSIPDSPLSFTDTDMESECYPCMPISSSHNNLSSNLGSSMVKEEPQSPEITQNNLLSDLFAPETTPVSGAITPGAQVQTSSNLRKFNVKEEPVENVTTSTTTGVTTVQNHNPFIRTIYSRPRSAMPMLSQAGGHHRLTFPKMAIQIESDTRCGISAAAASCSQQSTNSSNKSVNNINNNNNQQVANGTTTSALVENHSSRSPTVIRTLASASLASSASTASAASAASNISNAAAATPVSIATSTKVVFGHHHNHVQPGHHIASNQPNSQTTTTRHPIQTTLISSQPKGASGAIHLTEEEKRTLISEGYPVPQRLPLTKSEEKSLKKIRRKIKNKISAQESRRKKKEYMDCLEKRMHLISDELEAFKKRYATLENQNASLRSQLQQVQTQVANCHCIKAKDSIRFSVR